MACVSRFVGAFDCTPTYKVKVELLKCFGVGFNEVI